MAEKSGERQVPAKAQVLLVKIAHETPGTGQGKTCIRNIIAAWFHLDCPFFYIFPKKMPDGNYVFWLTE